MRDDEHAQPAIGLSLLAANLLARTHVLTLPLAAVWGAPLIAARARGSYDIA